MGEAMEVVLRSFWTWLGTLLLVLAFTGGMRRLLNGFIREWKSEEEDE